MKSVLITGISGGIGSTISDYFREMGYYVYGIDIVQNFPQSCNTFFNLDLNKLVVSPRYRKLKLEEMAVIPSLNCLINNAAVQILSSTESINLRDWQKSLNVNLTSPLILSKAFFKLLEKNNGSIINIGSIHSNLTKPNFVVYATSKSALLGLTQSMAVDMKGIVKVNSISPAAVETQMLLDGFNGDKELIDKLRDLHPSGNIGMPIEIAKVAFFLADSKIEFLNGSDLKIDGGISKVLHDI